MSENCRKCAGRLVAAKLQTLTKLARLARFERATAWFVARYSIQLSYRRVEGRYYREEPVCSQGLKGVEFVHNPVALAALSGPFREPAAAVRKS